MKIFWSTKSLDLGWGGVEGFPIILRDDMSSVAEANEFLRHHLVVRGRSQVSSWQTVGRNLYDFLHAIERLQTLHPKEQKGDGLLLTCRNDALISRGLHPNTINQRLYIASRYLDWVSAKKDTGNHLEQSFHTTHSRVGMRRPMAALPRGFNESGKQLANMKLRPIKPSVKFLTSEQIKRLLFSMKNESHKLIVRLCLQTGLRRAEVFSLPLSYIEKSSRKSGDDTMVAIHLDPRDGTGMATKGTVSRTVNIPAKLVKDIMDYVKHDRPKPRGDDADVLFLNSNGLPWVGHGRSFTKVLKEIGNRVGIAVNPHKLRHTYASHTLAALQNNNAGIDPLIYLQRQLGHSSIESTLVYLHIASTEIRSLVSSYDEEISAWSASKNED